MTPSFPASQPLTLTSWDTSRPISQDLPPSIYTYTHTHVCPIPVWDIICSSSVFRGRFPPVFHAVGVAILLTLFGGRKKKKEEREKEKSNGEEKSEINRRRVALRVRS